MTDNNEHKTELPAGWIEVKHWEISEINIKPDFSKVDEETEVSFIPMAAVEEMTGKFSLDEVRKFKEVKKGYTPFIDGDLIFAKITPCMENGKIAIVSKLKNGIGFGSTEFHTSRFYQEINTKFYFYYFSQEAFRKEARREMSGSAGQLRVPSGYFKGVILPLPPLPEQHRIVAKIEELFSDLDHSVAALQQAQAQIKIYRQAVLKYAFEGKLTARWRQTHTSPPAANLLAQIKAEREKQGKPAKSLPPLTEAELAELPELREGWVWEKLGNVTADMCLGKMLDKAKNKGEYQPYLRNINVRWNSFDLTDLLEMRFEANEEERYGLQEDDLIICEGGEPGRAAIWKNQIERMKIQKALHRVRFFKGTLLNSFVLFFLKYASQTGHSERYFTGTTIKHLTGKGLANFAVPLCSFSEQHAIVEEIEARLSVVDKLEETIETALQQAEALRQSILKQAFAGKLVPQNPEDEPAALLLERIRRQKMGETQMSLGKEYF